MFEINYQTNKDIILNGAEEKYKDYQKSYQKEYRQNMTDEQKQKYKETQKQKY